MHTEKANVQARPNHSLLTVILFWCGLVIVASNYLTIPLFSIFAQAFNASIAEVAWTGSAFSFCYAIGSLFSGPLSDRYGRKRVISIGLLVLTVVTTLLPVFENLLWVIVFRGIQGLAAASFAPVAIAYIMDQFPAEKIVTTIGFVSSSFLLSGIVGQVVSDLLSQYFGWKSVFYYVAAIYLLTTLLVLFFLPKTDNQQVSGDIRGMFRQFGTILTNKQLIRSYIIAITLLLSFVAVYTVLGDYLSVQFHLHEDEILSIRMLGIIGMLLAPFAGKLAHRYGILHILRGGLFLAGAGILMLGLTTNLVLLAAMSVVFVAGIALTIPSLISLVGDLAGKNHGAAVSLYTFILFIGTSLGPIVAISLLDGGSYLTAFASLALLLGISFTISLFIKK